ncbi:hypothetical protein CPB97_011629 [Podila verticillata]|nr:hypothetical protein CPB97_011629 [Podila verticillata]
MPESSLPTQAQETEQSVSASPESCVPEQTRSTTDASVEALSESLNNLEVTSTPSTTTPDTADSTSPESTSITTTTSFTPITTTTTTTSETLTTQKPSETPVEESEEELSPEEAKLRALGLKSTHRPGFYIHIDTPKRLRVQTKTRTFDLDRYCPHARADMLKWGVLRDDNTLRCGVHYWGFDLVKNGQCIAHPDETLNACPVESGLDW